MKWVRFSTRFPIGKDFPIEIFDKESNHKRKVRHISALGILPKQWCIKKELMWAKIKI